jgi:hypothetical protein
VTLTIDYRLTGAGWAKCAIAADGRNCTVTASYLSDALGKLVLAAATILAGAHCVSIGFDEEPGEYRWSIVCTGNSIVQVNILSFGDLWGHQPDSEGTLLLAISCTTLEFGKAVRDTAEAVLREHGLSGYKEKWIEHDFPARQLDLLQLYVSAWDNA